MSVPDGSLSAGAVSVLRKTAGPAQGSVLGGRRVSAVVYVAGKRQFSMAQKHRGSAGLDAPAVPLADGGTEDRAAEGKQSSEWPECNIMPENAENIGFTLFWRHFIMENEKNTATSTPEMVTIS